MTLEELQNEVFYICARYGYDQTEAVELYNDAVEAYEMTEEPIITDADFDVLKKYLIDSGKIEFKAGVEKLDGEKIPHFYPMLSIETVKHSECGSPEKLKEILTKKHDGISLDQLAVSWKLDGIALEAVYENGVRKHVLTRGERTAGLDVTHNVGHAFPMLVPPHIRAIIGEGVISKENFEEHLSHRYKNERNACSGIITSKGEKRANLRPYIEFVAFKLVTENMDVLCPWELRTELVTDIVMPENFHINEQSVMPIDSVYQYIQDKEAVRPNYKFRTDGIIIRNDNADLDEVVDGLYHAYTAYKYDAVQAETTILDIDFNLCNNGALFPMGVLDPVDVDGSTVSSVSLFNYANLVKQGLFIGAKVIIVKSGDIIPHVEHVLKPVYETQEFRDAKGIDNCFFDGVNIFSDEDLSEIRFIGGVEKLGLKDVGDALAKVLFDGGFNNIFDLFNLYDIEDIQGLPKVTKPVQKMVDQITAMFKNVSIKKLIQAIRFHGIGDTSSTKFAIAFTNAQGSLDRIEHLRDFVTNYILSNKPNVYETRFMASTEFDALLNAVIKQGNRINFDGVEVVISETAMKVVMTGSPKEFGYAKKADFIRAMEAKGIEVHEVKNLKDADYLITDDLNSTSSKMKNAEKLGKQIKTYGEF